MSIDMVLSAATIRWLCGNQPLGCRIIWLMLRNLANLTCAPAPLPSPLPIFLIVRSQNAKAQGMTLFSIPHSQEV